MASACISTNCVNEIAKAPVRVTYVNLYKWPDSDAEFIKSVVSPRINNHNSNIECSHPNNPKSRSTKDYINGFRKAKEISCTALFSIFRRLLSCTVKVDVVD
ncbi:PREDICTED: uncharacterized protein LOC109243949 [Nicotiana attenuata]|uniref:uncharacterized protein LOC109243949 n=1 Tax=Nicotiana attenuata TaxID=49451 RepID=UPI0009058208|nr:PREDICTED: uncharacterized protein LOC109243949 [Nicotiana attenuata]